MVCFSVYATPVCSAEYHYHFTVRRIVFFPVAVYRVVVAALVVHGKARVSSPYIVCVCNLPMVKTSKIFFIRSARRACSGPDVLIKWG